MQRSRITKFARVMLYLTFFAVVLFYLWLSSQPRAPFDPLPRLTALLAPHGYESFEWFDSHALLVLNDPDVTLVQLFSDVDRRLEDARFSIIQNIGVRVVNDVFFVFRGDVRLYREGRIDGDELLARVQRRRLPRS